MKYTDHDRLERIFSKGTELLQYIKESEAYILFLYDSESSKR